MIRGLTTDYTLHDPEALRRCDRYLELVGFDSRSAASSHGCVAKALRGYRLAGNLQARVSGQSCPRLVA